MQYFEHYLQLPSWIKNEYAIAVHSEQAEGIAGTDTPGSTVMSSKHADSTPMHSQVHSKPVHLPGSVVDDNVFKSGAHGISIPPVKDGRQTRGQSEGSSESSSTSEYSSSPGGRSRSTMQRSRSGSKGNVMLQSSEVLSRPIPEHELESASLSTIEKAEAVADREAQEKLSQAKALMMSQPQQGSNTLGVKPAASVSSIDQAPSQGSGNLNVKRAQSSTDVTNPGHRRAAVVQQPRARGRVSAPDRPLVSSTRGGAKFGSHQRNASDSASGSSISSGGSAGRLGANRGGGRGRMLQGASGAHQQRGKVPKGVRSPKGPLSPQNSDSSLQSGVQILGESEITCVVLELG